jgi:hypothetical protein
MLWIVPCRLFQSRRLTERGRPASEYPIRHSTEGITLADVDVPKVEIRTREGSLNGAICAVVDGRKECRVQQVDISLSMTRLGLERSSVDIKPSNWRRNRNVQQCRSPSSVFAMRI